MSSTNPSKSTLQSVADEIPLETHTLREQDQAAAVEMLPGDPETSQKICRSCNKDVSEVSRTRTTSRTETLTPHSKQLTASFETLKSPFFRYSTC